MTTFYLGGAINGCDDFEAKAWRDDAKHILSELGHDWIDPMDRDYRGREQEPGIEAEIVEQDKADIDECDVLIMNRRYGPSDGSAMETLYGWERGKAVLSVIPFVREPSPWVVYHSHALHHGVETAILDALGLLGVE